jgi:hypothetical protein
MATELLRNRINSIMCIRSKQGMSDPTPTLVDIERTHILYVNAHFKPFAAVGFEYSKVRPNSGDPQWGMDTQWNIPQFGKKLPKIVYSKLYASRIIHIFHRVISARLSNCGKLSLGS